MTTPDPMHAGTCECGEPIMRRTLSGVPPKRCEDCRRYRSSKGSGRTGSRTRERAAQGLTPTVQMRRWMRETRLTLHEADAGSVHDLMRECVAVAMGDALGVPVDLADSILCAIDRLITQGETGLDIRKRLNSNAFGIRRAAEAGTTTGLEAAIMSFGNETP